MARLWDIGGLGAFDRRPIAVPLRLQAAGMPIRIHRMCADHLLREHLLELINQIRVEREHGRRGQVALAEFEQLLPGTDIDNLCNSDYDDETIVDMCLGEEESQQPCSREELIELVTRLQNYTPDTTEAESNLMLEKFIFNCKHPGSSDLIFYPQEYFGGRTDPTPEEIVDKALRGQ